MVKPFVSGFGILSNKGNSIQGGGYYGGFPSQSIQGGGFYGVFDSHSIQGGGSVSGVGFYISDQHDSPRFSEAGFFFKVASLPASDMTLLDFNGGSVLYARIKMTSSGHIIFEGSHRGYTLTIDLNPGISTGVWYWCSFNYGSFAGSAFAHQEIGLMQVVAPGGGSTSGSGSTSNMDSLGTVAETVICTMGWGVSETTSYLAFPDTSGNELSKLEFAQVGGNANAISLLNPPVSDVSTSGLTALYLCRDVLGVQATILDSTTNHFDLTAGSQGITVVSDGPYP